MAFPLSIGDVWKVFEWANHRKAESKAAVAEWLGSVYIDLEDLSRVWFRICEKLDDANEGHEIEKALKIINRGDLGISQYAFAGRLHNFYSSASLVLGTKQASEFHKDFVNHLGSLLWERNRTRRMLTELRPGQSPDEASAILVKMREQTEAIQREAVSLQVLIKTFKAQA